MWQGAATDTSFRVRAKVTGAGGSLAIDGRTIPSEATTDGMTDFNITGLLASTEYPYTVESDGEVLEGTIVTFPPAGQPASFTFAAGSCAGQGLVGQVSNSDVFTHIRNQQPIIIIHMGDVHYRDINTNEVTRFRTAYDDVLAQPTQAALYRNVPIAHMWDDHDFGANDSVGDSPSRPAAIQSYREREPHYPLAEAEAVYQSWAIGRVRFIMTDVRTHSDRPYNPDFSVTQYPEKTALGAAQWQWFQDTLLASTEELICWVNTMPWHGGPDQITNWAAFSHERDRITTFLVDNGFAERMFIISGDWHGMGFEDGRNNPWGGFPIYHCAPLDSNPSSSLQPFPFSEGTSVNRGQWGKFTVADTGDTITLLAEGYINDQPVLMHSFVLGQGAVEPGQPVETIVPVTASHYGGDTVTGWKTVYNGEVINVLNAHVGTLT